jgi:hypothetical protein
MLIPCRMRGLKGALPASLISAKQFPKVFAWMERFNKAIGEAKAKMPKPTSLKGDAATQRVLNAKFVDEQQKVDASDPLGLQQDQDVEVWPTDSGFRHRDRGSLISLSEDEIVIAAGSSGKDVRLHFPRMGFRVAAAKGPGSKL